MNVKAHTLLFPDILCTPQIRLRCEPNFHTNWETKTSRDQLSLPLASRRRGEAQPRPGVPVCWVHLLRPAQQHPALSSDGAPRRQGSCAPHGDTSPSQRRPPVKRGRWPAGRCRTLGKQKTKGHTRFGSSKAGLDPRNEPFRGRRLLRNRWLYPTETPNPSPMLQPTQGHLRHFKASQQVSPRGYPCASSPGF